MEEEMDLEIAFDAKETDLDYEFDAARFFDFTRKETIYKAREAERWFESAMSYPPSPFVAKLFQRHDFFSENASTISTCKDVEDAGTSHRSNMAPEYPSLSMTNREYEGVNVGVFPNSCSNHLQKTQTQAQMPVTVFGSYNHMVVDKLISKTTSKAKPFPRKSTLMKPTASQLAKQNLSTRAGASRFQMLSVLKNEKSSCNSSIVESQAFKRQKLEGGHLRKVGIVNHLTNFVHKLSKKEGTVNGNSILTKTKITIPREPDLETANRAQRIRPKNSMEVKNEMSTARKFRARPLNRKILEAPLFPLAMRSALKLPEFQEFHLKTSERAMQHTSAVSSATLLCNDSDKVLHKPSTSSVLEDRTEYFRRMGTMDTPKQVQQEAMPSFKARPLNKKIFSSKGDIGVFRNIKRENTVPMEFKLHAEKRGQRNLPIELFSKLSLTSEGQRLDRSELKLPHASYIPIKGAKENRLNPLQPQHETPHSAKEKLPIIDGRLIKHGFIRA